MSAFEFVDELPPDRRRGRECDPVLVAFAAELRSRPGQWAKYPSQLSPNSVSSRASVINSHREGAPESLRDDGFEAAQRGGVLYVRYVGEAEQ